MKVNILIADDHAIVRHGLLSMIKELRLAATIAEAYNYNSLIQVLRTESKIDLLVCDINIPGEDSFKISEKVKEIKPEIRILIFSAYNEELYARRYIKFGADGFLHKDASEEEIKHAIVSILQNGKYFSNTLSDLIVKHVFTPKSNFSENPLAQLSIREMEVSQLLIKGMGLLEIANQLNIRVTTTSTYKTRVYLKLGINNLADLIGLFRSYSGY